MEEKLNKLQDRFNDVISSDKNKIRELEQYENKLIELIDEIDNIKRLYSKNIEDNNKKFETIKKDIENCGEDHSYWWMSSLNIPRQTGMLKRLIQNMEEYSRRFRKSFKSY